MDALARNTLNSLSARLLTENGQTVSHVIVTDDALKPFIIKPYLLRNLDNINIKQTKSP